MVDNVKVAALSMVDNGEGGRTGALSMVDSVKAAALSMVDIVEVGVRAVGALSMFGNMCVRGWMGWGVGALSMVFSGHVAALSMVGNGVV